MQEIMALQEKGWENVQEKCQGPAAQAVLHSLFCHCLGTCRGALFSQAGRRGGQSPWMAAELSAEMQLGKKDLTAALMVGGLMQTWPKDSRCTELTKHNI